MYCTLDVPNFGICEGKKILRVFKKNFLMWKLLLGKKNQCSENWSSGLLGYEAVSLTEWLPAFIGM